MLKSMALMLQARLDSSRLPGKALLPLGGVPMIRRVMSVLRRVPAELHLLLCPADSVEAFTPLAALEGFTVFPGPKEDVLERFCLAIRRYSPAWVIRATGDNPFVYADAARAIAEETAAAGADYGAYQGLPYGAGVEAVSAAALLRAGNEACLPAEREHVCPYLYGHPEIFRLHRPAAPPQWYAPDLRLTVDTPEDYEQACRLAEAVEQWTGEGIIAAPGKFSVNNFLDKSTIL
jgi:spore coat polysaccharide biosynthesis protein SpsF